MLCIGGSAIDRTYRARETIRGGTSNPVRSRRGFGGVARNVAENLARLGIGTSLATLIGDDENGRSVLRQLGSVGVQTDHVMILSPHQTAEYVAVLEPNGELAFGLADMSIFDAFSLDMLDRIWPSLAEVGWVFADCNLPSDILEALARRKRDRPFRLAVDAVSVSKALKLTGRLDGVDLLILNSDEAAAVLGQRPASARRTIEMLLDRGAAQVVLTRGPAGIAFGRSGSIASLPALAAEIVDVTGAGDALTAAILAGLAEGRPLAMAAACGIVAAALNLESPASVRPDLSRQLLESAMRRIPTSIAPRDMHV